MCHLLIMYKIVGIENSIMLGSGMLLAPFSQSIVDKVGEFNTIYFSTLVLALRLLLSGIILNIPPYEMYILATMEAINYILYWVACVNYLTKLVPAAFNATALGLLGSMQWILG